MFRDNSHLKLRYRGSVKEVWEDTLTGLYLFAFTDQYSIFDWGKMPDLLKGKGKALTILADFFFRRLGDPQQWRALKNPQDERLGDLWSQGEKRGFPHHSKGLLEVQGKTVLSVSPVEVSPPLREDWGYNYSFYQSRPKNCLVPLEVIFRFGLPRGSSLLKRLQDRPSYGEELGLPSQVQEGALFSRPILEFSSKLEDSDRHLSYQEAQQAAGLSDLEFNNLKQASLAVAYFLKGLFDRAEISLWDGKLEFALDAHRKLQLVDSIGPDELRLTYQEVQLSKEVLRQFYQGSDWKRSLDEAKRLHPLQWRTQCPLSPSPLGLEQKRYGELIYAELTTHLLECWEERAPWPSSLSLAELTQQLRSL